MEEYQEDLTVTEVLGAFLLKKKNNTEVANRRN